MTKISYSLHWHTASKIKRNHQHLPVTQVYVWIGTYDHKLILVSTKPNHWQFPGGHPKKGENLIETAIREILEETGLDITNYKDRLHFFGYYVISEKQNKKLIRQYLQVRYSLLLNQSSKEIVVFVNEKDDEKRKVNNTGIFSLAKACQLIPWLAKTQELAAFKKTAGW